MEKAKRHVLLWEEIDHTDPEGNPRGWEEFDSKEEAEARRADMALWTLNGSCRYRVLEIRNA